MSDALADLERLVAGMSDGEKRELDKLISDELRLSWRPNPGPQIAAYMSEADMLLFGGGAGGGKGLCLQTPLPSPSGWILMGDVQVGDELFDDKGNPCLVTAVSDISMRPCYRLTFDDGSEIVADDVHRWVTFSAKELLALTRKEPEWRAARRSRRPSNAKGNKSAAFVASLTLRNKLRNSGDPLPSGSMRDTREISETLTVRKRRRNHAIAVAGPCLTLDADLPIDPYVLGVWLGDGSSTQGIIAGLDEEVFENVQQAGYVVTRHTDVVTRGVLGLQKQLKALGVFGNKHVPAIYLRASVNQRLSLLQGLMDTDGHAALDGGCEFDNTRKCLIDAVYELVVSLGMKATLTEGVAKLDGRIIGPRWRVKFTTDKPVFRLSRKLERLKHCRRVGAFRYIVACEPVETVPTRCIAVDSPSHLYLCGKSMIPTHNTHLIVGLLANAHQRCVVFRRAYSELSDIAEEFLKVVGSRDGWNGQDMRYRRGNKLIEFGALEKPKSELAWRGRAHDLIAVDEAGELSEEKVSFVLGWLRSTDPKQRCRVVIATNPPTGGDGEWIVRWFAPWVDPLFADPAVPGELRWAINVAGDVRWVDGPGVTIVGDEEYIHQSRTFIPSLVNDNPYLKDTGYKAQLQALPEPLRSQLLKGDFLAGREDHEWQVIPTAWVTAANERWEKAEQKRRPMIALAADIALGGGDDSVLAALHSDCWFAPLVRRHDITNPAELPAEIANWMLMHRKDNADLSADCTGGWGSGVRSHLKTAHGIECEAIIFSAGTKSRTKDGKFGYKNLRAKLYWSFREALDPDGGDDVMLPPNAKLMAQLTAHRYTIRGTDILIESKDDVKDRVGSSPDDSDAVVMAWHRRTAKLRAAIKPPAPRVSAGWMSR